MQRPEKQVKSDRANVLGVGISAINLDTAVAAVAAALERKAKGYVCVTGVHGVSEAQEDPAFRAILNRAFLTTPDGMPTVWMGRWQGFREMRRVYGPDLMLRVCDFTRTRGFTHFLYGGAPGVAEALKERLEQRFPGLKVVGTYTPPFRPLTAGEEQCRASISRASIMATKAEFVARASVESHGDEEDEDEEASSAPSASAPPSTFMPAGCGRRRSGCSATAWSGCSASAAIPAASGSAT